MQQEISEFIAKPLPHKVLFFDEMLTPQLIQAAYWLCLLAVVWSGLGHMFSNSLTGFFEGIVRIIVGGILARVGAEVVMLFFKMHDNLETLANAAKADSD